MGRFWSCAKQPVSQVSQNNFTDWDRDKAFGFLLVYNYFHQFSSSTFLSVGFEFDTGFALFCFSASWRKFYCLQLSLRCVPEFQTCGVVAAQNERIWNGFFCPEQRFKKPHNYWEVASKCDPNFKISKFLSWQKQAQDYMHAWQKWDFFMRQ